MSVTRQLVADHLGGYLQGRLSRESLVDWAEGQIMDGDFESTSVRDVVARLGLADVRSFGVTWDDCQRFLHDLGYEAHVQIASA